MTERAIEFFYDIGSPYSYLASTQIEGLERRTGAVVRYRPFLLGAVFKGSENPAPATVSSKSKLRWYMSDMRQWADHYGVPFAMPSFFPLNTLPCERALVAAERIGGQASLRRLTNALFRGYWADSKDVSSPDAIATAAREVGVDPAALQASMLEQETKDMLRASTDDAVARGAFGAPTFFVGEELFFGNDRFPLIERAVRA